MKRILAICLLCGLKTVFSFLKSAKAENESPDLKAPIPSATASMRVPRDEIWRGASGGYWILWTKKNIVAADKNRYVFDARRFALERLRAASKNGLRFENYNYEYKILNAVGTMLFLEETTSYSPQSYTNQTYAAIDLTDPSAVIALTKFYSEAEILDALVKNPQIAEDLKSKNLDQPKTFKEFFAAYDREPSQSTDRKIDSCYFPKDFLESFYFERLDADKIVVNLGVPCRVGMREEEALPLELLLPSKPAVENDLKAVRFNYRLEAVDNQARAVIAFNAKSLKKSK